MAIGDLSVKPEDFFFLKHHPAQGSYTLQWWIPIPSSLQGLHFWEITVVEMKRNTFLLTPQMPWSRGKESYNPLLGLQ